MTLPQIKVKIQRRPQIKLKVLPKFPADVTVESPILLDRTGGDYGFSFDMAALLASANLNVDNHYVAIGDGALGFRGASPGVLGRMFVSNGAAADPSFILPPWFDVSLYATPQLAVDAADAAFGGIVWFPAAEWSLGSGAIGLDLRNTVNVRLMGPFSPNGGGNAAGAIRYTGTGTAIDISGAYGTEISGLELVGFNSSILILGTDDTAYSLIHRNMLYGNATSGICISIPQTQCMTISNNTVIGQTGIRGINANTVDFSNVITIRENVFLAGNTNHLQNAHGWLIEGNTFQGTAAGYAYSESAGITTGFLINFVSNFFSDSQSAARPWIETLCKNVTLSSNVYHLVGAQVGVKLLAGAGSTLSATGDQFQSNGLAAYDITTGNNANVANINTTAFGPGPSQVIIGTPSTATIVKYTFGSSVTTGPLVVGLNGNTLGKIVVYGSVSGSGIFQAQATMGSRTYTLPTSTGTLAVTASAPLVLSATTGNLTVTGAALTKTDDTNVTLTLGGTPASALLAATSITAGWTGILSAARGGTGVSTGAVVSVKKQVFTASGTYTPSAGMLYVEVNMVGGGGGGGGGAGTASSLFIGGGGAAGTFSRSVLTAAQISASQTVTIGAAGTGGAAGANSGTAGGATSLGSLMTAPGGLGGIFAQLSIDYGRGGIPGAAGTADLSSPGAPGQQGVYGNGVGAVYYSGGTGGSSYFGGGAQQPGLLTSATGNNATGYGSGGSGGVSVGANDRAGGNGKAGAIYITEFCSQ